MVLFKKINEKLDALLNDNAEIKKMLLQRISAVRFIEMQAEEKKQEKKAVSEKLKGLIEKDSMCKNRADFKKLELEKIKNLQKLSDLTIEINVLNKLITDLKQI